MSSRDDIRRRIAKRKRERERLSKNLHHNQMMIVEDEERYGFEKVSSYEGGPGDSGHPLFNKEVFLFKILGSACLVLVLAIIFRSGSDSLQPIKSFVTKSMEQDFQFTAVADWYENQFGKPLALLPTNQKEENEPNLNQEYALPAAARILEDFGENGQKITIETEKDAAVAAMSEGRVRFVGEEEGFGKTVIIQHADKSETWYGNLASIDVNLYEFVKKGASVGVASDAGDGTKGTFYFAIKKGDDFIDPIQVIQFD
ncbi:M23 family metallopeptidase [Robertmurraya andreesenii]|uniref:Stage IV sporulation protein FA n=1 Tax=Anoxybacillus andreesenii TaxID=1325932 RepID=A0ABT9V587_9BACL|nr:M23 family metallopeptidase [Robertmurraya andreesenii]MDQ0156110.1 stage IV sporulation protein FA [Robertmurraya andreesenii]